MCLESIYSDTYDMPIACYKKIKTGGTTCPYIHTRGHHMPPPNHYLADPEPMALPLQPIDHESHDQPSPCAA